MAEKFGEIIYLAPQTCSKPWERSITSKQELIKYLYTQPDAIIWSVKHDHRKDEVLSLLDHKKVYYSCCAYYRYNKYCDISLVDLPQRVSGNAVLWVKGKDPEYWYPSGQIKETDFLIVGPRGDKNELFFLTEMEKTEKEYTIEWIGGEAYRNSIQSKHRVSYTPFLSQYLMRETIPRAKIGIIISEHPAEGFPQTFLEMTMCGLPVIYLCKGLPNRVYYYNCFSITDKYQIAEKAEEILLHYNTIPDKMSYVARKYAIENYSLEKSYESILKGLE
jgi:glycosyltransferase involved in cell wall biosynthesis